MNIAELYIQAYTNKTASVPFIGTLGKAGLTLGSNVATALAIGIPAMLGAAGGMAISKVTDPTDADLKNFEKEAYVEELRARLQRVKKLPEADYTVNENTLRI